MIDYLERLFSPDKREWEAEREEPAPSPPGEEQPLSLAVSALSEGEVPQTMPASELLPEEARAMDAAILRAEEPQAQVGVFVESEEPRKMAEFAVREEIPRSLARTAPEQETVQPLPVAFIRETEGEAGQKRRQIRTYAEEKSAPRPVLAEEPGEELRRVSAAWEEPASETYLSRFAERYHAGEQEEELEHRLRRNSRRYDSGFFLY